MTLENPPGSQGGQPEERSLVVRSGETDLRVFAKEPFLQQIGFSPQLPERLMRLNEVLVNIAPPIRSVQIELVPGEIPIVQTHITHHSEGYRVFLEVRPSGKKNEKASINIEYGGKVDPSFALLSTDVQDFVRSTFPGKMARLQALARLSGSDNFDEDLFNIADEVLKPLTRLVDEPRIEDGRVTGYKSKGRLYRDPEVILEGQKGPLFYLHPQDRWNLQVRTEEETTVILHIRRFFFTGTPGEVERVMEAATGLFDNPPDYPYRWVDLHLDEPGGQKNRP